MAAVFLGPGRPLEMQRFPLPDLQAGEALVRIECSTLCGSDGHTLFGRRQEPTPSILGHEAVGTIVQLADEAPKMISGAPISIGQRVTWSTSVSCGGCDRCARGLFQKCRSLAKYGHEMATGRYALSGGLAEYIVLRKGSAIAQIERDLPLELVCPANCATATIVAATRRLGSLNGRRVLILGAGMLGLTATAIAASQSAATVSVVDVDIARLKMTLDFGATATIKWSEDPEALLEQLIEQGSGTEFDAVYELSGDPRAVEVAIRFAAVGANIALVGSVKPAGSIQVDPESIVRRCLRIDGVHNYAPHDLETALQFLTEQHRQFPFESLVTHSYALADVNKAVACMRHERPIRIAVRPS